MRHRGIDGNLLADKAKSLRGSDLARRQRPPHKVISGQHWAG
jgi:hypothetical protein